MTKFLPEVAVSIAPLLRCALMLLILLPAACRQQQLNTFELQLDLKVSDHIVGQTTLLVSVNDAAGQPLAEPGALSLRGDMAHAGMVPVFAEADAAVDGVFSLPFEWTMAGSWMVEATLTRPNGETARQTFEVEILAEADAVPMDHSMMDRDEPADMHDGPPGEISAAYMRIHNRGAVDITLVSAASNAAAQVAFHQTIVEDDMARMEALDGLRIPAGETIELRPGGIHIMLMDLHNDLVPEGQLALQLSCDNGETYDLDVSVMHMLMGELDDAVEIGDLVISNRWARPASAGTAEMAGDEARSH